MLGPASMLIGVIYSGCNIQAVLIFLCATLFMNGAVISGYYVNIPDLSTSFSGKSLKNRYFTHIHTNYSKIISLSFFYNPNSLIYRTCNNPTSPFYRTRNNTCLVTNTT